MSVNAIQRQRIAYLMEEEANSNGVLDKAERAELVALQKLAGIAPDAPIALVREWAAGLLGASLPNSLQRSSMTPYQRQVELARLRWPSPPLTPAQRICELFRQRADWYLTAPQREVDRLRA
jgi:hypothetical protein